MRFFILAIALQSASVSAATHVMPNCSGFISMLAETPREEEITKRMTSAIMAYEWAKQQTNKAVLHIRDAQDASRMIQANSWKPTALDRRQARLKAFQELVGANRQNSLNHQRIAVHDLQLAFADAVELWAGTVNGQRAKEIPVWKDLANRFSSLLDASQKLIAAQANLQGARGMGKMGMGDEPTQIAQAQVESSQKLMLAEAAAIAQIGKDLAAKIEKHEGGDREVDEVIAILRDIGTTIGMFQLSPEFNSVDADSIKFMSRVIHAFNK